MKSLRIAFLALLLVLACSETPRTETPAALPQTTPSPATEQTATTAPAKIAAQSDTLWIDVRTPGEFADGHLQGAINLPLDQIQRQFTQQFPDRDKVYALYCRSGNRSGIATGIVRDMGYTQAFNAGAFLTLSRTRPAVR